jgi:hypothetical protein
MSSREPNSAEPLTPCPRCEAGVGEHHVEGCTVEVCPYCGGQLLMCLMSGACERQEGRGPWPPPLDDRLPWTGEWPGSRECREFGWYARRAVIGWESCDPDDPEAVPDLNRLHVEAVWHRGKKRFVLPKKR